MRAFGVTLALCGCALDTAGAGEQGGGGVLVPPPSAAGCVTAPKAGHDQVSCDGLTHDLEVPERCLQSQCGLVIDIHGGTMNAAMQDLNTEMRALGRQYGYVVIQPNANAGLFNASLDDARVFAFASNVRDAFHLDPRRIHATGFSQGGYMTWRLICKHSDVLASAAPAAAAGSANISVEVPCDFAGAEGPTRELDILYMHGTEDALVNFPNALAQRDAVVRRFGLGPAQPVSSSAAHTWTRHENASGTRFEFIQHGYTTDAAVGTPPLGVALKGHCYPGSRDLVASVPGQLMAFGCKTPAPSAFTWGRAAMQFFLEHTKR